MTGYQPASFPDASEAELDNIGVRPGEDGSIWVTEKMSVRLPVESGGSWGFEDVMVLRQLDEDGKELYQVDTLNLDHELLDSENYQDMVRDGDGDIFLHAGEYIALLDGQGNLKTVIPMECSNKTNRLILLGDGRIGYHDYHLGVEGTYSYRLRIIDKVAGDWGETRVDIGSRVFPGSGDTLYYSQIADGLHSWTADAGEGEWILNWVDSNLNAERIGFFSFLEDGRLVVMEGYSKLVILKETDASALPEKKELVFATLALTHSDRQLINQFNSTNDEYRITVKEYNTSGEDFDAAVTRMVTEITAGEVPDIIYTGNLPIRQLGAVGLLEDLWPYIENDPEIGRENVMEHVFELAEQDGKLYQVSERFSIQTLVGAENVVGECVTWTQEEFWAALAAMPEGSSGLGAFYGSKDWVLEEMLNFGMDRFIDWENGKCHFDGEEFKSLLEFCGGFPDATLKYYDYFEDFDRIYQGQQMLCYEYVMNFERITEMKTLFGGNVSFVGYPNEWGMVGSSIMLAGSVFSMTTSCRYKEGAWEFIRTVLLPQNTSKDDFCSFYTNRESFENAREVAMDPFYLLPEDYDGTVKYRPRHSSGVNMGEYRIGFEYFAITQEEYDQLMELYNAVDTMYTENGSVNAIVKEVAASYFAGDKSLDETAAQIQSRVNLYLSELN